jgi:hypothetical protein
MQDFKKIFTELTIFFAGIAGAFVSLKKEENLTIWKVLFHLLSGGLSANYLTPLLSSFITINSNSILFCGFVIGYMGYKGADASVNFLKKHFKK